MSMSSQKFFAAALALVSSSLVSPTLSRPVILCDSSRDNEQGRLEGAEESYIQSGYKRISHWLRWSGSADHDESQVLNRSGHNKDQFISELQLREKYQTPKYPVVLCHGLSGFDKLMVIPSLGYLTELSHNKESARRDFVVADHDGISLRYWFGIKEALEEKGTTVMVAKVPGFGSIQERAVHLNRFISKEVDILREKAVNDVYNEDDRSSKSFKEKDKRMKVNLIAHSMGGLDARYLISELENKNYEVISLTTVTTPHRGSEVADYVVALAKQLPTELQLPPSMYQLTTEYMAKFNKEVKNNPNVMYFSYGAMFHPSWYSVFHLSWSIINERCGDNDGMVSVNSAKWGTYLGTLQNVDHLDLINWTNGFKRVTNMVIPNSKPPPINTVALYLDIADNLAQRGF